MAVARRVPHACPVRVEFVFRALVALCVTTSKLASALRLMPCCGESRSAIVEGTVALVMRCDGMCRGERRLWFGRMLARVACKMCGRKRMSVKSRGRDEPYILDPWREIQTSGLEFDGGDVHLNPSMLARGCGIVADGLSDLIIVMETTILPHLPEHPLQIGLFTDVQNTAFLRQQLLDGNVEFEYAFLDAAVLLSREHVLAACFRAINDQQQARLKSKNVHSEIVFSLSPNNNVRKHFHSGGSDLILTMRCRYPSPSDSSV